MTVNIVTHSNLERFAENAKKEFAKASHTHSNATTSSAGFMSAGDKTTLNALNSGHQKVKYLITDEVNSGTAFTVPEHTVNSDKLFVYFNGLLCIRGVNEQYTDFSSTSIKFTFNLSIGDEIFIVIYP